MFQDVLFNQLTVDNVRRHAWLGLALWLTCWLGLANSCSAVEFNAYFPLPRDAVTAEKIADEPSNDAAPTQPLPSSQPLPPRSAGLSAEALAQWQAYCEAWRQHHANPADDAIRNKLGIREPLVVVRRSSGRATAAAMRLPLSDMQRSESEHFVLLTDVAEPRATQILEDLERFYVVWTQLCFPLWKDRAQWDRTAKSTTSKPAAASAMIKHRVVLFANRGRYADVLKDVGPGIEQSTGFYADAKRVTFLCDDADDRATRYHEVTHQLMTEATFAKPRLRAGDRTGFWLIEGIACYVESTWMDTTHATVGGWHAPRLQYARHRVLGLGDTLPLAALRAEGRLTVQQREDLARWYLFASAYTHQAIDVDHGNGLVDVLQQLVSLYQMSSTWTKQSGAPERPLTELADYLKLTDDQLTSVPPHRLSVICLNRTSVTAAGLGRLSPQSSLTWFDGGYLPIQDADVMRFIPDPRNLKTLGLEATQVTDGLAAWLAQTSLTELDLSQCRLGDAAIQSLAPTSPLETLWLTGSQVSDASVDRLIALQSLQRVDVQQTQITETGLQRLRTARPELEINPLDVVP